MTLSERIQEIENRHGSLRAAARALKIDAGYLKRLKDGSKNNPSKQVLKKLKLVRVVNYLRTSEANKIEIQALHIGLLNHRRV